MDAVDAVLPAFPLDLDASQLFREGSVEFDKILEDLDLEIATDTTSAVLSSTIRPPSTLSSAPSGAGGLRELFGLQPQGWVMPQQQPQELQQALQPTQQPAPQAAAHGQHAQQQQQAQMMMMMMQQQQQQQQAMAQMGMMYALPPGSYLPQQQQQAVPPGAQLYNPTQAALLAQQQQQQLAAAAAAGMQPLQQGPFFAFTALGAEQQAAMGLGGAAVAAAYPAAMWPFLPAGAGLMAPPYGVAAAAGGGALSASTASLSAHSNGGAAAAAAAGAGHHHHHHRRGAGGQGGGRGRGAGAAAAAAAAGAPGVEKPKGPSQRFRERQKQTISNLEQEVTEKLAQLQALTAENEVLKLRSSVLEAVTSGREYHIRVIQEHGPPRFEVMDNSPQSSAHNSAGLPRCPLAAGAGAAANGAASSDSGNAARDGSSPRGSSHSCSTGAVSAGGGGAAATADGTSAPPPADDAAAADDSRACAADPLQCAGGDTCTLEQQRATITCIKGMSAEEIVAHWKQFLQDISTELLGADDALDQQRLANGELGIMSHSASCSSHIEAAKRAAAAQAAASGADDDSQDSSAFMMSKVCRWCGCTNSEEHAAMDCQGVQAGSGGAEVPLAEQLEQQRQAAAAEAAAANAAAAASTDARITALVNRYSYMTKFVALLNPGALYSLFAKNLETGEPAAYTDAHWRNVVTQLQLNKHQVTHIVACAELYFSSLSTVVAERDALQHALASADAGLSECQRQLLGIDGTLDQLQLLERLSSNLKKEHVLRIMLNCFVWGRILTAVQFAKTAVYSYPFFPDVVAFTSVLYHDQRGSSQ